MSAEVAEAVQKLELPPLRSLDDFVLGSARFQLPNLKNFDKWESRVLRNLLYYQTNYFLMFVFVYGIMIIFNPLKIICGLLVKALIIAVVLHFFSGKRRVGNANQHFSNVNRNQKWYVLFGALLVGYLLLHWFDAILLCSFTLLLPFALTFIHASLRLRNLKNKVSNTISLNSYTPMSIILDALDAVDSILS